MPGHTLRGVFLFLCSVSCSLAFTSPLLSPASRITTGRQLKCTGLGHRCVKGLSMVSSPVEAINQAFLTLAAQPVLKTKAAALVHPVGMILMYGLMLYSGALGLHWRSVRTMPAGESRSAKLKGAVKSRDRHYRTGSILLFVSIALSVLGCLNTWVRTGRLFATPHLFAGAGVTVLFSLSAACVPFMQSQTVGVSPARWTHILINAGILGLFTWQIFTGWAILQRVWEFVPWHVVTPVVTAVADVVATKK